MDDSESKIFGLLFFKCLSDKFKGKREQVHRCLQFAYFSNNPLY